MEKDKILHFIVGAMMGVWLIPDITAGLGFIGWVICLGVSYLIKEVIYDRILKKGNYELLDVAWTMIAPTALLTVHLISKI